MAKKIYTVIDEGQGQFVGVAKNNNGTFTAMTYTQAKDFKTEKGAMKWLNRMIAD